jgi:hypothetical protein
MLAMALAAVLPATVWAWGSATHHYIAQNYSKHLPAQIDGLRVYDATVDAHVTDPDTRRPSTPGEAPRHFIDIDWYPEWTQGTLSHDRATLEAQYGAAQVEDIGLLPWVVDEVVNTLSTQMRNGDWNAAALTIADLCHYVGDSSQPLHCCLNYDGQLTGNNGVHSRYETSMMSSRIVLLSTPVTPAVYHANSVDAMFDMIGASWSYVDDVLAGDNAGKAASGGSINSTYYNTLWSNTESFTRSRINDAAFETASFVLTAWINAGSPAVPGSSAGVPEGPLAGARLEVGPSPFRDALSIHFAGAGAGPWNVDVFDVRGTRVERLVDGTRTPGGTTTWRPAGQLSPGLYFVRLSGPRFQMVRRITRL